MEKFQVLEMAIEVVREVAPLVVKVQKKDVDLARQMRRCAASVPANIAEGRARRGRDRNHLWRVAMGSAMSWWCTCGWPRRLATCRWPRRPWASSGPSRAS